MTSTITEISFCGNLIPVDPKQITIVQNKRLQKFIDTTDNTTHWIRIPDEHITEHEPTRQIDMAEPEITNPLRVSPVSVRTIPNPHLDKETLNRQELREVIAWALERSYDEVLDDTTISRAMSIHTQGKPNSAAQQLVAFLGTLLYGDNNYIGPGKTGMTDAPLDVIVGSVPVLSDDDARARAHDIGLSVTTSPAVDEILPPLARAAQVAQPLFVTPAQLKDQRNNRYRKDLTKDGDVEPNPGPDQPNERLNLPFIARNSIVMTPYDQDHVFIWSVINGFSNNPNVTDMEYMRELLLLAGIEPNPGPLYTLDGDGATEEVTRICSDPMSATSNLNDLTNSSRVDDYIFYSSQGTYALRNGLDNQTDYVVLDDNLINYASHDFRDLAAPSSIPANHMINYAIGNASIKETLSEAPLGAGLSSALNNLDTFTGMERTATNIVNGESLISIFSRTSKQHFGGYLPLAKLFAYEGLKQALSGNVSDTYKIDSTVRADTSVASSPFTFIYPNTDGVDPAALLGYSINAFWCNPATAAQLVRGNLPPPPGWGIDGRDVAYIIMNTSNPYSVNSYLTICHLEYPFMGGTDATTQQQTFAAAGGVPVSLPSSSRPYNHMSLIQGPKTKVMFVLTTDPPALFTLESAVVGQVPINEWTGVAPAPAPVNILPVLVDFMQSNFRNTFNNQTPEYMETCQYLLKWCDLADWKTAMWVASGLINFCKWPVLAIEGVAALSPSIVTGGTVAPTVDAQVPVRSMAALGVANQLALTQDWYDQFPIWSSTGMPTRRSVYNPAPAGGPSPRPQVPVCCFLQDSSWLTKFGIAINFYKIANPIVSSKVTELSKARFRNIFMAMRKLSLVGLQMSHNWFQHRGVTYRAAFKPSGVLDRRLPIITTLYSDLKKFQVKTFGYQAYRPQVWNNIPDLPALPPALNGLFAESSLLDTPVYLFNHERFYNEEKIFYNRPDVNYMISHSVGKELLFQPATSTGVQAVFGVNIGGANSVRAPWHEVTASTEIKARWQREFKLAYAMARSTHLLNPTPITSSQTVWLIEEGGNIPRFYRAPLASNKNFLRWSSIQAPSDLFRNGARGILLWTMPFFPPEYFSVSGGRYILGANNQADLFSIRLRYNLNGMGSANFGMIQAAGPTDGDLVPTDNPF